MSVEDHLKLLQVEDLPPSVRQIIEDYEEELRKLRWQLHAVNGNLEHAKKSLRIARATINVLRGVIQDGKHISDMREKLKRKAIGDEEDTLRFDIIEHRVTYGGPGSDARTIHKNVGYRVVREFFKGVELVEKRSPFQERFRTKEDSMGCYSFYKIQVCEL
jgi:hypothetical protein